jgi:hypothetical protein
MHSTGIGLPVVRKRTANHQSASHCFVYLLTVDIASRACSRECGHCCLTCASRGAVPVNDPRVANRPFYRSPYPDVVCLGDHGLCIPCLCIPCLCTPYPCIPCRGCGLCDLCDLYPYSPCPCAHDSSHRDACVREGCSSSEMSSSCYYYKCTSHQGQHHKPSTRRLDRRQTLVVLNCTDWRPLKPLVAHGDGGTVRDRSLRTY